jgi:hypothetical protein
VVLFGSVNKNKKNTFIYCLEFFSLLKLRGYTLSDFCTFEEFLNSEAIVAQLARAADL